MDDNKSQLTLVGLVRDQMKNNIKQYSMFIALIAVWGIFTALTGGIFLSPRNLSNLLLQTSYIAVLAVGMVLVIVAGHIDLSVGSIAGFIGAIAAGLQVYFHVNTWVAIAVSLVAGILIGMFQGYWVAYRGIPAFIVTLAGMTIFKGAMILLTRGETIAPLQPDFQAIGSGYLPRIFTGAGELPFHETTLIVAILAIIVFVIMDLKSRQSRIKYGFNVLPMKFQIMKMILISALIAVFFSITIFYRGLPYSAILVVILIIIYSFLTKNTAFGRQVYAIGGNKEAAKLSGINIRSRTMMIFVSMGILSAISGVVFTARLNSASSSAGNLFELDTIAAAIIGGTSTMGGEGTVMGAIIGALLMASLNNGMSLMNLSAGQQYVFRGMILLIAVWFDIASRKKNK